MCRTEKTEWDREWHPILACLWVFLEVKKKKKPKHIYKDYWGSRLAKHGEGIEETEFGGRVRKGAGEPGVLA